MSNRKKLYLSSSEEQDDQDKYIPKAIYPKSAVFNYKTINGPIAENKSEELDVSREEAEDEEAVHLAPKMKANHQPSMPNYSAVQLKTGVSEHKVVQKAITAAYTFKLKSPVPAKKKKNDPVALFQQTSTAWKKDRFLTSRGNKKEGRKLDLDKRNKDIKTIV